MAVAKYYNKSIKMSSNIFQGFHWGVIRTPMGWYTITGSNRGHPD